MDPKISAVFVSHNSHHFAVFSGLHPLIQSRQSAFYSQIIYKKFCTQSKDCFNYDIFNVILISWLVRCQTHSCINHMITANHVSDQFYPLFIHVGARSRSLSLFSVGHNFLMNSQSLLDHVQHWTMGGLKHRWLFHRSEYRSPWYR